jgi:hypothetical protein
MSETGEKLGAVPCPVCGKPWRKWVGSKLTAHARCSLPIAEQDALLARTESQAALAEEFGVSIAVMRAWLRAAEHRRRDDAWRKRQALNIGTAP